MVFLLALVAIVTACFAAAALVWGMPRLAQSHQPSPTVSMPRQDESNKAKGHLGKAAVERRLREELPGSDYQVFSNISVPGANKSSRPVTIDHIVVSRFGVFAIGTRAWPGLISSTNDPRVWKQQVGRSINKHPNPIEQNERQVRALARYLNLRTSYVYGLVCFSPPNTRFADEVTAAAHHPEELVASILSSQKVVLNSVGVTELSDAIAALR